MGCSNPHPHGQIWANSFLPNEVAREDVAQRNYYEKHGSVLLVDYIQKELAKKERIVVETEHWVAVVPYWAVWPFETLLLPKVHVKRLTELTEAQAKDLAVNLEKNWQQNTITYLKRLSLIRWASMPHHLMAKITNIGRFMRIFIHHYCVQLQYVNLWLVMKCWVKANVTSPQNKQQKDYER